MLQILLDHLFRHLAYRGAELPPRPEMPAPVPLYSDAEIPQTACSTPRFVESVEGETAYQ